MPFVYFIGAKDIPDARGLNKHFRTVKIGKADDPQKRLEQLQTSCPMKLKIIVQTTGNNGLEKAFHSYFKRDHIRGEWFFASHEMERSFSFLKRGDLDGALDRSNGWVRLERMIALSGLTRGAFATKYGMNYAALARTLTGARPSNGLIRILREITDEAITWFDFHTDLPTWEECPDNSCVVRLPIRDADEADVDDIDTDDIEPVPVSKTA